MFLVVTCCWCCVCLLLLLFFWFGLISFVCFLSVCVWGEGWGGGREKGEEEEKWSVIIWQWSVQFKIISLRSENPIFQVSQRCLLNNSSVRLIDDGPFSFFQRSPNAFSFAPLFSRRPCFVPVTQAPQHFRTSAKQATCGGCFSCQFICSVISLHSDVSRAVHPQDKDHYGTQWAGIAQWLERRTRDWKVAGSNPFWNGGRIFFSRVDFLCWLLFRYPFHPRVTAVARKRSRSFCQKCRWQVTAKHAYTLRMWLCMKWHGAWLYGVHRTCAETAAVSSGTSHASAVSTPLRWIFKKRAIKASHSCRTAYKRNESAQESGE